MRTLCDCECTWTVSHAVTPGFLLIILFLFSGITTYFLSNALHLASDILFGCPNLKKVTFFSVIFFIFFSTNV